MPAPYARSSPSSTTTPNSSENQKTLERKRRLSSSARRLVAPPAMRRSSPNVGGAVQRAERGRGEEVAVAEDLVEDVGLGRVERDVGVADVLGRVEDAVG